MRIIKLLSLCLILAACLPRTPTSTPPPQPSATDIAGATPTAECAGETSHCRFYNQPLNSNPFFDSPYSSWPPSRAWFGVPNSPEQIKPTIQEPSPAELNDWDFRLVGNHNGVEIPDWHSSVFCKNGECEVNVTAVSGTIAAVIEYLELQTNYVYLVKLVYEPRFSTFDSALPFATSKQYWQEVCYFHTDAGLTKYAPVQTVRDDRQAWGEKLTEEIVVAVYARRDTTVRVACGFNMLYPTYNGQVAIQEFGVYPVTWDISSASVNVP